MVFSRFMGFSPDTDIVDEMDFDFYIKAYEYNLNV